MTTHDSPQSPNTLDRRPELLTRGETADLLRISKSTLTRITAAGQIRSIHVGRQIRYARGAVERYLQGYRPEPIPEDPTRAADLGTWPPTPSLLDDLSTLDRLDRPRDPHALATGPRVSQDDSTDYGKRR